MSDRRRDRKRKKRERKKRERQVRREQGHGQTPGTHEAETAASGTPRIITITNDGPKIVASTYWGSETEKAGTLYCSPNAGAIRVLLPSALRTAVDELRKAEYAILSFGPWPDAGLAEAAEILWEDHTDRPYAWHLSLTSFATMPAEPPPGRSWVISVWLLEEGRPRMALERPCHWRRVTRLPCLKTLGERD